MSYERRETDYVQADIPGHGFYQTYPGYLDLVIQKYLPASIAELRAILTERDGGEIDYSGIVHVSEALFILAEYEGLTG